jgi:hypothetical protein
MKTIAEVPHNTLRFCKLISRLFWVTVRGIRYWQLDEALVRCRHAVYGFLFSGLGLPAMPGIDFGEVRSRVRMAQVLELAGFVAVDRTGDQLRGPCPIHGASSPRSRSFSVNLSRNTFHCFRCGAAGNQLDLWVAISKLPLHEAAADLCARLAVETPLLRQGPK